MGSNLLESHVSLLRMVCFEIESMELGLESGHDDLVHGNIRAVKFDATNTILNISIPSQTICFQIKDFDITIVVTSSNTSFLLIVGISKTTGPAIRFNDLRISRLK